MDAGSSYGVLFYRFVQFFFFINSFLRIIFIFIFIHFLNTLYLSKGKHEGEKFVSNRSFLVPYF